MIVDAGSADGKMRIGRDLIAINQVATRESDDEIYDAQYRLSLKGNAFDVVIDHDLIYEKCPTRFLGRI